MPSVRRRILGCILSYREKDELDNLTLLLTPRRTMPSRQFGFSMAHGFPIAEKHLARCSDNMPPLLGDRDYE